MTIGEAVLRKQATVDAVTKQVEEVLSSFEELTHQQESHLLDPLVTADFSSRKALLAARLGSLLRAWANITCGRALISVLLVHSREDFGSCAGVVETAERKRYSEEQRHQLALFVAAFWRDMNKVIPSLGPDKVYQDGLPVPLRRQDLTAKIVDGTKTPNFDLLRKLKERGAIIVPTENMSLLLEERRRIEQGITDSGVDELLLRRSAFAVSRINETLLLGEIGIFLAGALHLVDSKKLFEEFGIWEVRLPSLLKVEIRRD